MSAWILIDEPSYVAGDTVHAALEMALRREQRSLVIVPSARPGKALVVAVGGVQTRSSAAAVQDAFPDAELADEAPAASTPGPLASGQVLGRVSDQPFSPAPEKSTPLDQALEPAESRPSEQSAAEELSTAPSDQAQSDAPEPPAPRYAASGFLGLADEPVLEDEPQPPRRWWQKLFG